jgi:transposase
MRAYSRDLREKIVNACARQFGSQRAIAALFGVSRSFVEKLLHRYRTSGDLGPKPHAGGQKPRLEAAAWPVLQRLVQAHPDATLEELCTHLAAETGIRVSVPTMCRVLQRLRLPRKKNRSRPPSGDRTRSTGAGGLLGTYRPARPSTREVHR